MRISKEGKIRRQEILDAALDLFYEKGYEKTSVNDINNKVGVSKGAFYYHFKSKEEVLDKVISQQIDKIIELVIQTLNKPGLNALEKFNEMFLKAAEYKINNIESLIKILTVIDRDENIIFRHKFYDKLILKLTPLYKSLIDQGIKEGLFNTAFPENVAEFIMYFSIIYRRRLLNLLVEIDKDPVHLKDFKQLFFFIEDSIERMLGTKKGTIKLVSNTMFNHINKKINLINKFEANNEGKNIY